MDDRGTILVVDDDVETLRVLTGILQQEGYRVRPANSGQLALASIAAQLPDLVLLDIRMPDMDGFEVCRRLKAEEAIRNIPVIFQSVATDLSDRLEGLRLGAVDYVSKPYQREELLARVRTHLELGRLHCYLEELVEERTASFESVNKALAEEIQERLWAEKAMDRLNRELKAIGDCNQAMLKAEDEQVLLTEICRIVCEEAGYRMVWVGYPEFDEAKTLRPAAWSGADDGYLAEARITWDDTERGHGPGGTAIRTGESSCIQDFALDSHAAPWRENALQRGYRSCIALPLKNEDAEVFGALIIYSAEPNTFTPEETRLMEELAGDLAFGIRSLRNHSARKQAERKLQQLNLELEQRVRDRTAELSRKNAELQQAYNDLKIAQMRLLQQDKMASIGQLAAGVAHEINNPMGFISSNLSSLGHYLERITSYLAAGEQAIAGAPELAASLAEQRKTLKIDRILQDLPELISESHDGAERVRRIVQELKAFSHVDRAEQGSADLNEGLESTLAIVWNELKYKATVIRDYGQIPLVSCCPGQLNQVFMNLLVNAAQAIEKQGEIRIRTWEEDERVWVAIGDTGSGIPEEVLKQIFDPFFTTKEVGKGTGLGLSIAYDIIVNKHGGTIEVQSEVGKGSTFTISLPISGCSDTGHVDSAAPPV